MLNVLCTVLAIVFIMAKVFAIAPVAYWSWTLVLAPIWAPIVACGLVAIVAATVALLVNK
jgi:hypothetical protein